MKSIVRSGIESCKFLIIGTSNSQKNAVNIVASNMSIVKHDKLPPHSQKGEFVSTGRGGLRIRTEGEFVFPASTFCVVEKCNPLHIFVPIATNRSIFRSFLAFL
jgi:hypothetical protein